MLINILVFLLMSLLAMNYAAWYICISFSLYAHIHVFASFYIMLYFPFADKERAKCRFLKKWVFQAPNQISCLGICWRFGEWYVCFLIFDNSSGYLFYHNECKYIFPAWNSPCLSIVFHTLQPLFKKYQEWYREYGKTFG